MRIAGDRGEAARADGQEMVASDQINRPGRALGRRDQGLDGILAQQPVDPFGARQPQRIGPRRQIGWTVAELVGGFKGLLPEPAQFLRVSLVESNYIGQRADFGRARQARKIGVEALFQLEPQHQTFIAKHLAGRIIVDRHEDRPGGDQIGLGLGEHCVHS